jgi:superfamily I DNA/RNA helicase
MQKTDLTAEQLACVEFDKREHLLIKGPPGSGKTLTLLMRGHELANRTGVGAQLITYTNTLAQLARKIEEAVIGLDSRAIGVATFHSWCAKLLRRLGIRLQVIGDDEQKALVQAAVDEAHSRYYDTASRVRENTLDWWTDEMAWIKGTLLPDGRLILEREDYLGAQRMGRGSALLASARQIVWDVFESYQAKLRGAGGAAPTASQRADWDDFAREALIYYCAASGTVDCRRIAIPEREQVAHLLVDEAQDLHQAQLLLLAKHARRTVTLVADTEQKIYKTTFSYESAGLTFDSGNVRALTLVFRPTGQIFGLARSLLAPADAATPRRLAFDGPMPILCVAPDPEQEEAVIAQLAAMAATENPQGTVAVLARTWSALGRVHALLAERHSIRGEIIQGTAGNVFTSGVKLTTLHSAKGLEFDIVIVAQVNEGVLPQAPSRYHGDMAAEDLEEYLGYERQLLYVAMTRARQTLYLTCSTPPSRFLDELDATAYQVVDAQVTGGVSARGESNVEPGDIPV